jgi:hypothetical protein
MCIAVQRKGQVFHLSGRLDLTNALVADSFPFGFPSVRSTY